VMNAQQLHCYTEEVWIHARAALGAFEEMRRWLADARTRQRREVWVVLQGFLVHTGMVSKLLSPPTKALVSRNRGETLRAHLNVPADSALLDRSARNAIEHLDERMDNWLKGGHSGFLECVFENRKAFEYLRKDRYCVRRVFLMEEMVFVTQGETDRDETMLLPLHSELVRIVDECEKRFSTDDPFHYVHPERD
jgi:hypothetical protein